MGIINGMGTSVQSSFRVRVSWFLMRVLLKPMIVSLRSEYWCLGIQTIQTTPELMHYNFHPRINSSVLHHLRSKYPHLNYSSLTKTTSTSFYSIFDQPIIFTDHQKMQTHHSPNLQIQKNCFNFIYMLPSHLLITFRADP